jgi:hypothetical protein
MNVTIYMSPYQKLRVYWKSLGLNVQRGVPESAVRLFETQNSLILPPDVRDYFLNVNGMEQVCGHDCDANGFSFWPLQLVKSAPAVCAAESIGAPTLPNAEQYYVFADYMQWSWAYAIRLGSEPWGINDVVHVGTVAPKAVAGSFTEFVELYLTNSQVLYPNPR